MKFVIDRGRLSCGCAWEHVVEGGKSIMDVWPCTPTCPAYQQHLSELHEGNIPIEWIDD